MFTFCRQRKQHSRQRSLLLSYRYIDVFGSKHRELQGAEIGRGRHWPPLAGGGLNQPELAAASTGGPMLLYGRRTVCLP